MFVGQSVSAPNEGYNVEIDAASSMAVEASQSFASRVQVKTSFGYDARSYAWILPAGT